jgi:hypothetical protein
MRSPFKFALVGGLLLVVAAEARAQAPPGYRRVYSYSDEPVMSINRSYLGYSNLVSDAPGLPPGGYPSGYRLVPAPGYRIGTVPDNGNRPGYARRPLRRFGWRRAPR